LSEIFGVNFTRAFSDPFDRDRSDLRDFDPRRSRQTVRRQRQRERKTRPLRLTRDCHGNHRPGTPIEKIVTQNDYRAQAGLLSPTNGIEIGPVDLSS
jgi:hypothetical protein